MRWLLILLLAGCSHAHVSNGPAKTTGASQAGLHVNSSSLATLVLAGMFLTAATEDLREPRPFPSFSSSFSDWFWFEPKPELDATRSVSEQDCTRPVALEGNLRCR